MKMRGIWYTKLTETLGGNFYLNFIQTQLKLVHWTYHCIKPHLTKFKMMCDFSPRQQ